MSTPRVAVCLDGCEPAYFEDAIAAGVMPVLARWMREGTSVIARAQVPTFTNPNNVSIVCGAPASVHGISGNHFFDRGRGVDVPMNEAAYLRAPTILGRLAREGQRVFAITAKDKLTRLINPALGAGSPARGSEFSGAVRSAGNSGGAGNSSSAGSHPDSGSEFSGAPVSSGAFSAEKPGLFMADHPPVDIYSAEASLFVFDAGIFALERNLADILYLSTTDYIQHKHAPGSSEARAFYAELDRRFARFDALGARVGITADHGMNAKTRADGSPNIIYLSGLLPRGTRVTLPITDPYVVHHGALGGCAMVYLSTRTDQNLARELLAETPGIELVIPREEAAVRFELPEDRIGDLMVLAGRSAVLGKSPEDHDLSHVQQGLRSHGSLHEDRVPLIFNFPVSEAAARRNWDLLPLLIDRREESERGPPAEPVA